MPVVNAEARSPGKYMGKQIKVESDQKSSAVPEATTEGRPSFFPAFAIARAGSITSATAAMATKTGGPCRSIPAPTHSSMAVAATIKPPMYAVAEIK
jgi:hypothetical protein